jgi:hypothetical protein
MFRPPWMVACLLAAMLLAILGAAQPYRTSGNKAAPPLAIVIDCGMTMSAGQPMPRFQESAHFLAPQLQEWLVSQRAVDLYRVPGGPPIRSNLADWAQQLQKSDRTAIDTSASLAPAVRQILQQTSGAVVVLSDQSLNIDDPRLIQVPPDRAIRAVGISGIGAKLSPHPQVMVRLRNQSAQTQATVVVRSGDLARRILVDLPAAPGERAVFVDFPELYQTITAQVEPDDEGWPGSRAWLVRQARAVRVRAMTALPPDLRRMIDVYNQSEPASQDPVEVQVVGNTGRLPVDRPAVVVASAESAAADSMRTAQSQRFAVVPSSLTGHVDWSRVLASARLAPLREGEWNVCISSIGRPALAVGAGVVRRVWVGIDAPDWSRFPDYVVFWKNVFDYLGGGRETFSADMVHDLSARWPGLRQEGKNGVRAFNAPDVTIPVLSQPDWRKRLDRLPASAVGRRDLSGWLFLGALVLALAAMAGTRPAAEADVSDSQDALHSDAGASSSKMQMPG